MCCLEIHLKAGGNGLPLDEIESVRFKQKLNKSHYKNSIFSPTHVALAKPKEAITRQRLENFRIMLFPKIINYINAVTSIFLRI